MMALLLSWGSMRKKSGFKEITKDNNKDREVRAKDLLKNQ